MRGSRFPRWGTALPVALVAALALPALATAQEFIGKDRVVTRDTAINSESIRDTVDAALVAAKKSFGLFWRDPDGVIWFARMSRTGRPRGKPKVIARDTTYVSAVWVGNGYRVAYVKKSGDAWLVEVVEVNEKGRVVGTPTTPQPTAGFLSTHDPALGWDGTSVGLLYDVDFTSDDGLYFQRLDSQRVPLGDRVYVGAYGQQHTRVLGGSSFCAAFIESKFAGQGWAGGVRAAHLTGAGALANDVERIAQDTKTHRIDALAGLPMASGYAFLYGRGMAGAELLITDGDLQPAFEAVQLTEADPFGDHDIISYPMVTSRGEGTARSTAEELWLFWTSFMNRTVTGAKVTSAGDIVTPATSITDDWDGKNWVLGAATLGKITLVAWLHFEGYSDDTGTIFTRAMKR